VNRIPRNRTTILFCAVVAALTLAAAAHAQPTFSKSFAPSTIGPGSVSTLTFQIANSSATGVRNLAFTDNLPAGVAIAAPANVESSCSGSISAPDGGDTISFSGGSIFPSTTCTINVDVTSSTVGTHTNVSGDLTSDAGNSGSATADLIVTADRPGFTKSFSPSSISLGGRSTLVLTIDNTANSGTAQNLSFTDNLPSGMTVASPANASTTCTGGTLTAPAGSSTISYSGLGFGNASVAAGASCTVSADVVVSTLGSVGNTTGELTSISATTFQTLSSGKASAVITVTAAQLSLTKTFVDDPAAPGGSVTLEFTIRNLDRRSSASNLAFTDDLDATLSGLAAVGTPIADPCGSGSSLSGTSVLSLTGGNLAPEGSCTFSVTLQVPAGAAAGSHTNVTSQIAGEVDGSPTTGNAAADVLFVSAVPLLEKSFIDDPVGAGDSVTLEFTITNTSSTSSAADIAFEDEFAAELPTASATPANGFCGAGSTASFVPGGGFAPATLTVSGASLDPGASCTFSITLDVIESAAGGIYPNTTTEITATVDGAAVTGSAASDDLVIVSAPRLEKEFVDDPAAPGDTVTLQFTLIHEETAAGDATAITFSDDLMAALSGLVATGLPQTDVCGEGSQIDGTTTLLFTGGSLAPGESCIFSVLVEVPEDAPAGSHTNTTSNVVATVLGVSAQNNPASDDLEIAGLVLSKEFTDDPVLPGAEVTLRFTIENTSPISSAANIAFTDDLDAAVDNMTATALPGADPCGTGSSVTSLSGGQLLAFSGGTLDPGESCTFDVTATVPAGTAEGTYGNTTSSVSATVDSATVIFDPAQDELEVVTDFIELAKEFIGDPVAPGNDVTLRFTITNLSAADALSNVAFTDDLDAVITGLASTSGTSADVCGTGSEITGTSVLAFTGGSLAAGASCSFDVTVNVPATVSLGSAGVNVTSSVTGELDGFAVTGGAATDTLTVEFLAFSKAFSGDPAAGGTVTLSFTIANLSGESVSGLAFNDDLDTVLSGLVAAGLPMTDVCGVGSSISGTSLLSFSGGSLLPGGSCTFNVELDIPESALSGDYLNVTSTLRLGGAPATGPASATLTIPSPLSFSKAFSPDTIGPGGISTLRFEIGNTGALPVGGLAFSDDLPAEIAVASPANTFSTCSGTVSAPEGGNAIAFSGGSVAASSTCSVSVDVTSSTPGTHTNVSEVLSSDAGDATTATADLTVATDRPGFTKSFSPSSISFGGRSTLVLTIDNTASTQTALNLTFTDNLPAGMTVASPANASTTCSGGTLNASPGSSTISYAPSFFGDATVAAGASCSVSVDVVVNAGGSVGNTTEELTSTLPTNSTPRSSGKASAVIEVTAARLTISKAFTDDPVAPGSTVTLEFTIRNLNRTSAALDVAFTDDLDAVLSGLVAVDTPLADVCGAGSTLSGSGLLTLTGGNLPAEGLCTFSVTLEVPAGASPGGYTNVTSLITATVDGRPLVGNAASDDLFVSPAPRLEKSFIDDPVGAGDSVTLEFTITNTSPTSSATDIAFEDEFAVELPTASATPANGFCGAGSTAVYTPLNAFNPASLTVSGASLAPGASCTFSITLDVIESAAGGIYPNTTSEITATVDGETLTGNPASDDLLVVSAPRLEKEFVDDPAAPGDTVTLQFTLIHEETAAGDATAITFSDDLMAALDGLVATGLPQNDICGAGSQIDGTTTLLFTGGSLVPGESCTFSVFVEVPADAPAGSHTNTTSNVVATILGVSALNNPASDDLEIAGLVLTKEFTDDPVLPGADANLRFTIENTSPISSAADIVFSDDLDAAVDDMTATALPSADPCGAGSSVTTASGDRFLIFAGGSLGPGESCTFDVTVTVPASTAAGTYSNVTSGFSATVGGSTVSFDNAQDELEVVTDFIDLAKEFVDDPVAPGGEVTLRFTISNASDTDALSNIAFTDDLDAALTGLASTSGTLADVCGAGSEITGTSTLAFTGGSLAASASCTFDVTSSVPETVLLGSIGINTTSTVTGELGAFAVTGAPATDTLEIEFLTFSKAFSGDPLPGGTVTLSFTIENLLEETVGDLSFVDNLEGVISGLVATGLPMSDVCGAGSTLTGTSVIGLTGGNLLPGGSCTFSVELEIPASAETGTYLNVTSTLRQGGAPVTGSATATLTITDQDSDGDGVFDSVDLCPDTVIPEGVPTIKLGTNRYALVDEDFIFDTAPPPGGGGGPGDVFTTTDTGGCSCEQIIEIQGLGNGHTKWGCSVGAMRDWVEIVNTPTGPLVFSDGFETGSYTYWSGLEN